MLSPTEALITLNLIPGLGSIRIQGLLEYFGTAELVLEAPVGLLENAPRIGTKLARTIADWRNCTNVHAELDCAAQHGVRVITLLDDEYPAILRRMTDPPIVLYLRGEWRDSDAERSVAIVGRGTHQPTVRPLPASSAESWQKTAPPSSPGWQGALIPPVTGEHWRQAAAPSR